MTIEHRDIQTGEQHVVANWVVSSVNALTSLTPNELDIGKQAWVAGRGHYVLAAVSPNVWELVAPTVASAAFDADTRGLTLTLTDSTTITVTVPPGVDTAGVNALIAAALEDYYTASEIDGQFTALSEAINTALNGKEPAIAAGTSSQYWRGDKTWQALDKAAVGLGSADNTSDADKPVSTATQTALNGKQAALGDVITANTYGSSTQYPIVTVNAKGIVTGVTLQTVPTPTFTDATFAVQQNGSPSISATWSLTAFTASRVHTYPDKDINFGNMSFIATTDGNTLSGTRNRIVGGSSNNVSGTGNTVIGSTQCDVSSTQCVITNSQRVTLAGTTQKYVTVNGVNLQTVRSFEFPSGTQVIGSSAQIAGGVGTQIKTLSSFMLGKPSNGTVLVQDASGLKPYAAFQRYSPSYFDVGLHRVTLIGSLNDNNYSIWNVLVRRDFGVTVTTIEAGGGYLTLTAAQNGDRLDLVVGTTYTHGDTIRVFVESYYTDLS